LKRLISTFLFCFAVATIAAAQNSNASPAVQMPPDVPIFTAAELAAKVPAPRPEDVKSRDAILAAIYDVISGPAGTRDWNRFRSLFLPQARFTHARTGPDGSKAVILWNVDQFVRAMRARYLPRNRSTRKRT
jgi:hypothetical protein